GGISASGNPTSAAAIYDPSDGSVTPTSGTMSTPRVLHTATLLPDNTVLIAGGVSDNMGLTSDTAELYDPAKGTFKPVKSPSIDGGSGGLAGHTATLLPNSCASNSGMVLITGGFAGGDGSLDSTVNTTFLYNPSNGTFSASGALTDFPAFHTATLLPGCKVL